MTYSILLMFAHSAEDPSKSKSRLNIDRGTLDAKGQLDMVLNRRVGSCCPMICLCECTPISCPCPGEEAFKDKTF